MTFISINNIKNIYIYIYKTHLNKDHYNSVQINKMADNDEVFFACLVKLD